MKPTEVEPDSQSSVARDDIAGVESESNASETVGTPRVVSLPPDRPDGAAPSRP